MKYKTKSIFDRLLPEVKSELRAREYSYDSVAYGTNIIDKDY
jgi:hypothetical protein